MEFWLATNPNGKSQFHKYDGKNTFCNSKDGLGYKPKIFQSNLEEYNMLQSDGKICANCNRVQYKNKIMIGAINGSASPKSNLYYTLWKRLLSTIKPQSDIDGDRMEKANFDAMQDISLGEE